MAARRAAIGLALLGVLAGCAGAPAASVDPSVQPSMAASDAPRSAAEILADCQPLELLLPSGQRLDLTGSWVGDDRGPYELRQLGDCLWWAGQNPKFTMLYVGRIRSDLVVEGTFATISASKTYVGSAPNFAEDWIGTGTLTLTIEPGADGTNATVELFKTDGSDSASFPTTYPIRVTHWTRVDDVPDHPIPAAPG